MFEIYTILCIILSINIVACNETKSIRRQIPQTHGTQSYNKSKRQLKKLRSRDIHEKIENGNNDYDWDSYNMSLSPTMIPSGNRCGS